MFWFLREWDKRLAIYEKDIELSLRWQGRAWIVYAQLYCERLFELYNNSEGVPDFKVSLDEMIYDDFYCGEFSKKTGFGDFNTIRIISRLGNEAKHNRDVEITEDQIKKWLESIYTLSLMTYNYLNNDNIMPYFNKDYFDNILKESDVRFQQIVEYAALKLVEKDEIIDKLKSDMDEMRRSANDNKKKIDELKEQINEQIQEANTNRREFNDKLMILNNYISILVGCWHSLRCSGYDVERSFKQVELPLVLGIKKVKSKPGRIIFLRLLC